MKAKKILSLLCVAAMSVTMLAGCGSAKTDSSVAPETTESVATESTQGSEVQATTEAQTEEQTAGYNTQAIEEAGDITITMMVSGTEYDNDFETQQLPALVKEKWPNLTLEVTKLPDDNYYTSLKTKLASGECPDIILVQPMYAGQNACFSLAEAGYLAELDDMKTLALNGDNSGFTYNDHVYGLSEGVAILGTYYNKAIFEECGITSEPQTWAEFLDACKKIKEAGHQPIVMGDKDAYVLQFGLYQLASAEIYPNNADFDTQLRTGDTSFTDEGTWDKVLTMYKQLYDEGYIDASQSLGLSASQAITEFIDGNAAMTFDGSFNAAALLAEGAGGDFERGYFPIPGENGVNGTATCLSAGPAIYANSKYIDACKELLDYWMDGESDVWKAFCATGRNIVTYGEGADATPNYDLFAPFVQMLQDGKAYHWSNQAWPSGTENTMEEMFSEMVGGQGTEIEDITQGMQDKFEDLLED